MSALANAPHVQKAWDYALGVSDGSIVACDLIRKAADRFLNDLERDDFPFYLDAGEAERACIFIETLPHIKGEWAKRGLTLELEPWQCFIVVNIFGWRYIDGFTDSDGNNLGGLRRFQQAYIEVARKNAKSTLAAAIGLYMLVEDGEAGAEVYSSATTRNQAKIVFNVARLMAKKIVSLPLEVRAHNIHHLESASLFEALHAQGETLDGYNIHCAINDELHAWKSKDVYDVIETATGARRQPLIFNITTAGTDTSGICYTIRTYCERILLGKAEDESFFGLIYTLDKDDDWTDRRNWPKANPNWNVSVYPMDVERLARKAMDVVSQQTAFLTKRMNIWTNAAVAWMNMRRWEQCHDDEMRFEDFQGEEGIFGIDLASKIDLCSGATLFSRKIDGEEHLYVFMKHWLPQETVDEEATGRYEGWVDSGHLSTTPGNVIDIDQIQEDVSELSDTVRIKEIGMDPMHNSTQFGVHMTKKGYTVIDVRPYVQNFSEPMKYLEAFVKDGRLHHNCPILSWMIGNVEVKPDAKDNIYPRKSSRDKKIDGVIALLIAINRYLAADHSYKPEGGIVRIT